MEIEKILEEFRKASEQDVQRIASKLPPVIGPLLKVHIAPELLPALARALAQRFPRVIIMSPLVPEGIIIERGEGGKPAVRVERVEPAYRYALRDLLQVQPDGTAVIISAYGAEQMVRAAVIPFATRARLGYTPIIIAWQLDDADVYIPTPIVHRHLAVAWSVLPPQEREARQIQYVIDALGRRGFSVQKPIELRGGKNLEMLSILKKYARAAPLLLIGPAGVGKSFLPRALSNSPVVVLTSAAVRSPYHGESERIIRDVFEIILSSDVQLSIHIDELSSIVAPRDASQHSVDVSIRGVFNYYLQRVIDEGMPTVITAADNYYMLTDDEAVLHRFILVPMWYYWDPAEVVAQTAAMYKICVEASEVPEGWRKLRPRDIVKILRELWAEKGKCLTYGDLEQYPIDTETRWAAEYVKWLKEHRYLFPPALYSRAAATFSHI